ncbi:hypothetical protein NL676_005828 [Syzygium grande]|nr:hypothetical protein NL676_005828 [Syzygium grande]
MRTPYGGSVRLPRRTSPWYTTGLEQRAAHGTSLPFVIAGARAVSASTHGLTLSLFSINTLSSQALTISFTLSPSRALRSWPFSQMLRSTALRLRPSVPQALHLG